MIPCMRCAEGFQIEGGGYGPEGVVLRSTTVHVQDHNLYRTNCPEGHPLVAILEHHPFELLFESGLEALVDGYFRESISSFAAALERLYEFSIRVQLTAVGVASGELEKMWKSVGVQSERQLGMYIGVRTLKEGRQPPTLSQSLANFRNSVIHKGYFPSADEALMFGEAVFKLIKDEVLRLDEHYKDGVITQAGVRRTKAWDSLHEGEVPHLLHFGLAVADRAERPFLQIVKGKQASMRRWRAGEAPSSPNMTTTRAGSPSGPDPGME